MQALVVDDAKLMRMILGNTLKELGFEVVEAVDGEDGWAKLKDMTELPSIIFLDWNMPKMSGFELVEVIRKDSTYADVPVVMVTTEGEMERIAAAIEAGANDYVMKPFTKDVIVGKLQALGRIS